MVAIKDRVIISSPNLYLEITLDLSLSSFDKEEEDDFSYKNLLDSCFLSTISN